MNEQSDDTTNSSDGSSTSTTQVETPGVGFAIDVTHEDNDVWLRFSVRIPKGEVLKRFVASLTGGSGYERAGLNAEP